MASAALKQDAEEGVVIPGEGEAVVDEQTQARDFEAEAREHGWRPKEEFPGDAAKWVDAEAFMKRADDVMPLLKAQNARLKRDMDALKKDLRRATNHFEGAEKRAFERAKTEIEARVEAAIESGDLEAGRAAIKEMSELKPVGDDVAPASHSKEAAQEALDTFREENPWYDKANLANASEIEINGRLFYDRMVDKHLDKTKEMPPAEFFGFIRELTIEKYPQLVAKPARHKPASAVEGPGSGGRGAGRGKTWDNLPDQAKRQYERFIGRGLLGVKSTGDTEKDLAASRAYYARTHDWEGFQA